jgi:hypothetical protein
MVSPATAARLADEFGSSTDEVMHLFDDVSDDAAQQFLGTQSASSSVAHTAAGWGAKTAADQPSRIVGKTLSTGQKTLLGGGAIAGGTLVGSKFLDTEQQRLERLARQDQSAALQEIMNAQHLSGQEKQDLVERLTSQGFFESPSTSAGEGDGLFDQVLGGVFGNVGLIEWAIILIALYFGGKAVVAVARDGGGSTGGGS